MKHVTLASTWDSVPTFEPTTKMVFTYNAILAAFSKALEVISVSFAPTINKPLASSRAYVVEVPNEISSTWSCLLGQVTGGCQID